MDTPTLNEARRAVIQLESQFALPPAASAALTTISDYLESLPAAHIAAEIELAKLRAQVASLLVRIPTPKVPTLSELNAPTVWV